MSEEIFDIVNERDEVVGQNTRREVHARGLWHRAVHVLVFNARGEVFLQKRSMKKDIAAGKWDSSASGHLDSGEDYDACAVREVREETWFALSNRRCKDFSRLTHARRRAGNSAGFTAAKAKGRSSCIPKRSRRAIGSRRTR